jgi:hypothetical protein
VLNPLRWRKITWLLDLWIAAFAIWMISGDRSPHGRCVPFDGAPTAYCGIHAEIGAGQTAIFLVWCVGFIVLSFAWLMSSGRPRVQ